MLFCQKNQLVQNSTVWLFSKQHFWTISVSHFRKEVTGSIRLKLWWQVRLIQKRQFCMTATFHLVLRNKKLSFASKTMRNMTKWSVVPKKMILCAAKAQRNGVAHWRASKKVEQRYQKPFCLWLGWSDDGLKKQSRRYSSSLKPRETRFFSEKKS